MAWWNNNDRRDEDRRDDRRDNETDFQRWKRIEKSGEEENSDETWGSRKSRRAN